jgi:hypothetical protein
VDHFNADWGCQDECQEIKTRSLDPRSDMTRFSGQCGARSCQ